jgi:hypothetical protein
VSVHKYKTDLSVNGIEQLKKELLNYKNVELRQKINTLVRILAEKGVLIAQANITSYDAIFTGELLSSISAKNGGGTNGTAIFYIVADSKHAVFVEFGTGQIGSEAPYPYPLPPGVDWEYNSGKTIFEISPGQYGWFYPKGDKWYFTQGMPSRPFMYETAMELQELILKTAREVFK